MSFPMPDGRSLAAHLRERDDVASELGATATRARSHTTKRGKDLVFAHIIKQRHKAASTNTHDAADLAELRALEAVGVRRRTRWFNDRLLREMAGPLTVSDLQRTFNPVPFGHREPSALEVVSQPQHAAVWEGFRNIDMDRQDRLLQRWDVHRKEQQQAERSTRGCVAPLTGRAGAAAIALQQWGRVGKKARTALRKANLNSVLSLETQVLEHLETAPAGRALAFTDLDAWGRLLLHGLADFWGLAQCTSQVLPAGCCVVAKRTSMESAGWVTGLDTVNESQSAPEEQEQQAQPQGQSPAEHNNTFTEQQLPAICVWRRPAQGLSQESVAVEQAPAPSSSSSQAVGGSSQRAGWVAPDITCTDVLSALADAATGSLSARALQSWVSQHVLGSEASHSEADWVVV